MSEFKISNTISFIMFGVFMFLFGKLYSFLIDSDTWAYILTILTLGIIASLIYLFSDNYIDKLEAKLEKEFNNKKWFDRVLYFFAIIGVVWSISFLFNKKSCDLILTHPEDMQITLIFKDNWGLKERTNEVKYINGRWKYKYYKDGKGKWLSLPESKDIYESDYLNTTTYY